MTPSLLEEALEVAAARLEAIGAHDEGQIHAGRDLMALAFNGLDMNMDELVEIASEACDPYAESIIEAAAVAWRSLQEGESPQEVMDAGAHFGVMTARNLTGAFCVGVLLGELHRSRTLQREATSDD